MSLALLFHYLMLNMFRMLIHPSSRDCDLFVISLIVLLWYDVCWCYVVIWLGWCGIRMQPEALLQPAPGYHTTPAKPQGNTNTHRTKECFSLHPDTTPPQPNHKVVPTHIVPKQYSP